MGNGNLTIDDKTWIRESLSKKVSKELHEVEIKRLDGEIDNLEKDLNKGHSCDKGAIIDMNTTLTQKNQEGIQKMYKWFARGLAVALVLFIGSGVAFVWSLATMTANVETNTKAVEKIDKQHEKRMEMLLKRTSQQSNPNSTNRYYSEYMLNHSVKKPSPSTRTASTQPSSGGIATSGNP